VLVGGVVDDEVDDHPDAAVFPDWDEARQSRQRAELGLTA
jgi:hypothetical protein